ncbi:hypothetical protein H257_00744 [Aphanomyces astaci]|uniref:ethanolamine kinase n=1 Tax=Aphanomyces astaci TaxID=112090 RepID=W4HDS6_APHAT|nr:hypothetical protein H257_00744 [Aphanomyces astaci]ETV89474.1 hypothetical protein H257_00744 [Aphanomyces astaci]|eukprot:XP_009821874.1 hypothetical protein H257_00744 [Aphanomyces astaci]
MPPTHRRGSPLSSWHDMHSSLEPLLEKLRPVHVGLVIAISTCVCILATYHAFRPKDKPDASISTLCRSCSSNMTASKVVYLNNANTILDYSVGARGEDFEFDDCKHVAQTIYPGFRDANADDIVIKIICGGITNRLYRLTWQDKSVLLRIYGEHTEVFIDRDIDNETFAELSRRGFAPMYHGRFRNGRIEGWVDGVPLEPHQMGDPKLLPLIATEVGKMHAMDMKFPTTPCLWKKIHVFEELASLVRFDDPLKQKALASLRLKQIQQRVQWAQTILPSAQNGHGKQLLETFRGSPIAKLATAFLQESVFSHNDMLSGNVLYNPSWSKVQVIDYEYGGYNYRGYDFANHFCEHCGLDMNLNAYPSQPKQVQFYKAYLAAASPALLHSLTQDHHLDEFVAALHDAGNLYALASHLFWGLWAVVQASNSTIEFDFLEYARVRLEAFDVHADMFGAKPQSVE